MFKKKETDDADKSKNETNNNTDPIEPDEILGKEELDAGIKEKAAILTGGAVAGNMIKMAFSKKNPLAATLAAAVVEGLTYVGVKNSTEERGDIAKVVKESDNQMLQVQKMLEGIKKQNDPKR